MASDSPMLWCKFCGWTDQPNCFVECVCACHDDRTSWHLTLDRGRIKWVREEVTTMALKTATCEWCLVEFHVKQGAGRPARFCSMGHAQLMAQYRKARREAGMPEDPDAEQEPEDPDAEQE